MKLSWSAETDTQHIQDYCFSANEHAKIAADLFQKSCSEPIFSLSVCGHIPFQGQVPKEVRSLLANFKSWSNQGHLFISIVFEDRNASHTEVWKQYERIPHTKEWQRPKHRTEEKLNIYIGLEITLSPQAPSSISHPNIFSEIKFGIVT